MIVKTGRGVDILEKALIHKITESLLFSHRRRIGEDSFVYQSISNELFAIYIYVWDIPKISLLRNWVIKIRNNEDGERSNK